MQRLTRTGAAALLAAALAAPALADELEPGSALIYPVIRSDGNFLTTVTLTNTDPALSVIAHYAYLEVTPSAADPLCPGGCDIRDVFEFLTPNDTITVLTACHNPLAREGYLVVYAEAPGGPAVSFNRLIGSEMVFSGQGAIYSLAPYSFQSPLPQGAPTDLDGDTVLDFDGMEYSTTPEVLYMDNFLASLGNKLVLINLTGGPSFKTTVRLSGFNDNEFPLSHDIKFQCWFDEPIDSLSAMFSFLFLLGTPNDPTEWDIDCDGVGDLETGWIRIDGITADSPIESIPGPSIIGAVAGTSLGLERGRPLWQSGQKTNGDFLNFGPDDPEFP